MPVLPRHWAGTAPRVRGAHRLCHGNGAGVGNSPAGAGSTGIYGLLYRADREQPRGCGEHVRARLHHNLVPGTAPRVRGARSGPAFHRPRRGNSPAGAGSTRDSSRSASAGREQPRGCGEHRPEPRSRVASTGTAPRVRGAPHVGPPTHPDRGNSPAGAGSTACRTADTPGSREQPRGCGEHLLQAVGQATVAGTAPRVRGAPVG